MSALAECTDDEIVSEMQTRLGRGTVGYAGLISPHQLNFAGMWHLMCAEISDLSNADFSHPYVRRLRSKMLEIVDSGALPPEVFAINTTFHGREAFEDHRPSEAAE